MTVLNTGGVDIEAAVVLTAQPAPSSQPGAVTTNPPEVPSRSPVLAIDGRSLMPSGRSRAPSTTEPPWPTYQAAVTLAPDSEKTLVLMVRQAQFGYEVKVVDDGRVLARAPGPIPRPCPVNTRGQPCFSSPERVGVLLLSDVVDADARLEALPQKVAANLDVIQLRAATDFPDEALHLSGLDGVVLGDFDTASLSPRQRRALQDYVSFGGSLVVSGGAAWSRTLGGLPSGLAPLRASATASVSLAPLVDLLGGSTTATAAVATGELTGAGGRMLLAAAGGIPLVVEAAYGAGRVIQLTYDPLAEPIASDPNVRTVAWDQALGRVANRWGSLITPGPTPPKLTEDQLWSSPLEARPWPSWPSWGVGLLAIYCMVVGPAAFLLRRRFRPSVRWAVLALVVVLAASSAIVVRGPGTTTAETVVEVQTLGVDGAVLTSSYRGVLHLDPPSAIPAPRGATSTVFTARPVFRSLRGQLDPLLPPAPNQTEEPVARGVGGGTVVDGSQRPEVRITTRPWQLNTVQTLTVDDAGPALEASLRLVGASASSPGRVQGRVTNRGAIPLRQLRAQTQEGQARLAGMLAPGETTVVDAPLVVPTTSTVPQPGQPPAAAEELAMFAAAGRSFTGPSQIALTGVVTPSVQARTSWTKGSRIVAVVVAVFPLQGAETVLAGTGGSRPVAAAPVGPEGRPVTVFDLLAPSGAGPLSIRYQAVLPVANPPFSFLPEVFNWATGTWRTLPLAAQFGSEHADAPLETAEVNNGLVRFRARGDLSPGGGPAQLLLTSISDAEAKAKADALKAITDNIPQFGQ